MKLKAKREVIILVLAGLSVAYFLFDFFVLPHFKKSASVVETEKLDVQKLLAEMAEYSKAGGSIDNVAYTFSKAEQNWTRDPFLVENLASAAAVESRKSKFNYTGFILLGNKKLAVINGIEYQVGESLATEGFVVRAINPNDVVLEDAINKSRLAIPIQE